jgi:L-rhamnose mutarotase
MYLKKSLFLLGLTLSVTACQQKQNTEKTVATGIISKHIQRFAMFTGLKRKKMAYYKQLHAAVWPAVQKKITECNIKNYSIFLKEINNRLLLFSYFEYTGTDFDRDMKKMATDTATQRWWKETDPCQEPLPEAAAKKQTWSSMEEVFHED